MAEKKAKGAGGRPRKYNEPTVLTNVRFPESTLVKLNQLCARGNKSRSELLNEIIGAQFASIHLDLTHEMVKGVALVRIGGELNPADLNEARIYVEDVISRYNPKALIVNLESASLVSSTAAAWLVNVLHKLNKLDKQMALCCVSDENTQILNLIGLQSAFPTYSDESTAVSTVLNNPT